MDKTRVFCFALGRPYIETRAIRAVGRALACVSVWSAIVACSSKGDEGSPASRSGGAIEEAVIPAQAATADSAMSLFVTALREMDATAFLALFSQSRPWLYANTLVEPAQVDTVPYSRLARDLENKSGLYESLFYAEGLDTFRDNVVIDVDKAWRRVGEATFVPPYVDEDDWVYVRWRKEGDRWVVDAIAHPSS